MPLTQTTGNRTFSYSHCLGSLYAFSAPVDLALMNDSIAYVLSRGADRGSQHNISQRWSKWDLQEDTEILKIVSAEGGASQFLWPSSITLDAQENIYIADEYLNKILVFSKNGELITQWGTPGTAPGHISGPAGLRMSSSDYLYISESKNNRIQIFTKDGEFLGGWGTRGQGMGELQMPAGVHIDMRSDVYVADWGNDRVQKFSPDGKLLITFGSSGPGVARLKRPTSVSTDSDGDVYIVDWGNNRVQVFDADGEYVTAFYGDARELSKSASRYVNVNPDIARARKRADTSREWGFRRAIAVTVDSRDRILILESISARIQVYVKEKGYIEPQFNL